MNTAVRRATRSGRDFGTRLAFWLHKAYRGAGRPVKTETLDEQYRSGGWERLDTLEQMMPCMIVAAYVHQLFDRPRVLDVGCGHGRLARLLSRFSLQDYLGIDLSAEAIRRARSAGVENAQFLAVDFEHWSPAQRFDAVVFLDSLYYANDPLTTMQRYSRAVAEGGALIVCMYRYSNNGWIQRRIARRFDKLYETRMSCEGKRWDIQVFRPLAPAAASGERQ